MAKDLHSFLEEYERDFPSEVVHIEKEMDARYEVTALVSKLERQKKFPILIPVSVGHFAAGIGAGGAVQEQVVAEKTNPISVVEETVRLLKGLLRGESVPLADFPRLARRFRYNQATSARLYFPSETLVPVVLAAGGVKTTRRTTIASYLAMVKKLGFDSRERKISKLPTPRVTDSGDVREQKWRKKLSRYMI